LAAAAARSFEAIRVKIRDKGIVRNTAIHIALCVSVNGGKEVLGFGSSSTRAPRAGFGNARLRSRSVDDILLAAVDGLKDFPEANTAVFPDAIVQTCVVHLRRNSMDFVFWKKRNGLAKALKEICRATDAAERALTAFEAGPWGIRYHAIGQSWRRA
jgi:putative transposase